MITKKGVPRNLMTARERWSAVLNHGIPDKIPVFYRATEEFTRKLLAYLNCDWNQMYKYLHIDLTTSVDGRYVGPPIQADKDEFGVTYTNSPYEGGIYREATGHPLADFQSVDEIKANYQFPSPDWWDYSLLPQQIQGKEEYFITCFLSEPFLQYSQMRGYEQALLDLVLNPEIAHYCLDRLFDLAYAKGERLFSAIPGKINMAMVAEDLGSQTSLLMSPDCMREFLFPSMLRMMSLAHQAGAKVIMHSDGTIHDVLPELINIGVDVLDPIQWRCPGMERKELKHDFGDQLVFHGAMDNQYTMVYGTPAEVIAETRDNIRILGAGGGLILGPCHAIQVVSPPENVIAFYNTVYEEGWY